MLYVVFVWIPDDQLRKTLRTAKFEDARKEIRKIEGFLLQIRDREIKNNLSKATKIASGLIDSLASKTKHQGRVEEKILPLLQNMSSQIERWSEHESGTRPLDPTEAKKVRGMLLKFDDLFLKYQESGIDSSTFLTGMFETEAAMQEAGINPEGDDK